MDQQWQRLQPYLLHLSIRGAHLRQWNLQPILNAITYLVNTGC